MKSLIHTSLSPNAEADDVRLALSLIFAPWKWKRNIFVKTLEKSLEKFLGVQHVITVDSGRTALYTILKSFGIGEGHEVLLQAYTCVAVPEPILWSGAKPVYVDSADDFTIDVADLEKKITAKSKAVIVQHTFGKSADIENIILIARKHKLFVIEDCAHALGGKFKNSMLGAFGDAAFFSFGRDKIISSVFGGAIAVKDEQLYKKINNIADNYPLPSNWWVLQQLMHPIVLSISKFTYNFLSFGKIFLEVSKRLHIISKAVERVELSGGKPSFVFHKFSPALAMLASNQLKKISRFNSHRLSLMSAYTKRLDSLKNIQTPLFDKGHAGLRYTIIITNTNGISDIFARAKKSKILLGDWYATVLAPCGVNYEKVGYVFGSCPQAEYLAAHSLNLPTHVGIELHMIEPIIRCVTGDNV